MCSVTSINHWISNPSPLVRNKAECALLQASIYLTAFLNMLCRTKYLAPNSILQRDLSILCTKVLTWRTSWIFFTVFGAVILDSSLHLNIWICFEWLLNQWTSCIYGGVFNNIYTNRVATIGCSFDESLLPSMNSKLLSQTSSPFNAAKLNIIWILFLETTPEDLNPEDHQTCFHPLQNNLFVWDSS